MTSSVRKKVQQGDLWYVDDQRASQLGSPGSRWALEERWRLFARAIDRWLANSQSTVARAKVLDAGCGDGINMSVIENLLEQRGISADLTGTDYNSFRLKRAFDSGSYPVLEADLRSLPFPSQSFDIVLCSHVLEHIEEDRCALGELSRIVKPEGLVIIAVPNEGCTLAQIRNKFVQPSILEQTDHVQFYTEETLINRAASAGLEPIFPAMKEGFFVPHLSVYTRMRGSEIGRKLIQGLLRAAPSQATGIVVAFQPKG